MATKRAYRYSIEMEVEPGRWVRHPWTIDGSSRPDTNHALRLLYVNQAPLESLGLYGPLRIARYPADAPLRSTRPFADSPNRP